MSYKKKSFNIDSELYTLLEDFAQKYHVNVSSALSIVLSIFFNLDYDKIFLDME